MGISAELAVTVCVQIAAIGVFIGITKSSLNAIQERLKRIEDKQDHQSDDIAELRERVAVIESKMDIRKNQ